MVLFWKETLDKLWINLEDQSHGMMVATWDIKSARNSAGANAQSELSAVTILLSTKETFERSVWAHGRWHCKGTCWIILLGSPEQFSGTAERFPGLMVCVDPPWGLFPELITQGTPPRALLCGGSHAGTPRHRAQSVVWNAWNKVLKWQNSFMLWEILLVWCHCSLQCL